MKQKAGLKYQAELNAQLSMTKERKLTEIRETMVKEERKMNMALFRRFFLLRLFFLTLCHRSSVMLFILSSSDTHRYPPMSTDDEKEGRESFLSLFGPYIPIFLF